MKESSFELPIWGPAALGVNNKNSLKVRLQKNNIQIGQEKTMDPQFKLIAQAEKLLGSGEYGAALTILDKLGDEHEIVRRFKIECYVNLGDNPGIIRLCNPPRNDSEIVYCLDALWHEGRIPELTALLQNDIAKNSKDKPTQQEIARYTNRLKAKRRIDGKD